MKSLIAIFTPPKAGILRMWLNTSLSTSPPVKFAKKNCLIFILKYLKFS
jgi:hypothetical protein